MTAVGFITFISVLSRLLGLLKKCIIIIYILCIDCAENNKILFDLILFDVTIQATSKVT